jgi:hypothetical protein
MANDDGDDDGESEAHTQTQTQRRGRALVLKRGACRARGRVWSVRCGSRECERGQVGRGEGYSMRDEMR